MKDLMKKHSCLNLLMVCVLIAAMALTMTGCGGKDTQTAAPDSSTETELVDGTIVSEGGDIGEGETAFTFEVTGSDGETASFTVHTDAETVGEALQEVQLIAGEMGDYGLYVKTVNGETADYDTDGHYWAFYVNGEYGMTGVDSTPIEEGAVYAFVVE